MIFKGKFITLEGGEGAGKSTQAKRLAQFLAEKGVRSLLTREVGGSDGAEEIRGLWLSKTEGFWDPMTEVLLVMAARRDHLVKKIWPALKEGIWVISDRFIDSTRAYQGVGLDIGIPNIDAIYRQSIGEFWPDLTLLLDLPVESGLARVAIRNGPDDRYQQKSAEFHETLRQAYLQLAKTDEKRIRTINANLPLEEVSCSLISAVAEKFGF